MKPEHIHLLINHIPIHGLIFSTLFLIVAVILRNRLLTGVAMAMITVAAISIPFVMASGEAAFERYQDEAELHKLIGEDGLAMAKTHYEHAETGAKATYLLIVVGIAGLGIWKFRPTWLIGTGWVMVALCAVALILNAWIASSGGRIRRPDFRVDTPVHHGSDDD